MKKLSVVINTRNESEPLPRLLTSLQGLADEIIIVDMHSTDDTKKVAQKYDAVMYDHEPLSYVEPARNFGISKATGDWILVMDPDEEISASLASKIKEIVLSESAVDYYALPRKNIIFGKWIEHSRWWPDYTIRLFKKGHVSWDEAIHSVPVTQGKGLDLPDSEAHAIIHHSYASIEDYIARLNRYTGVQSAALSEHAYTFVWRDLVTKPVSEFISRYFAGEGYKDGVHGLTLAGLQAFSEFIVYSKVWQLEKFPEKKVAIAEIVATMKKEESALHYWQADTLIKHGAGLTQKIRRKLKI